MPRNRHAPHAYLDTVEGLPGDAADLAAARSDDEEAELSAAILEMGKRIQAARFEFERDRETRAQVAKRWRMSRKRK